METFYCCPVVCYKEQQELMMVVMGVEENNSII
jgi:hypothetical protein